MANKSPYEILGVSRGDSLDEIASAYKRMAKMYHPDRVSHLGPEFRQLAEVRMKEINAAYEDLRVHISQSISPKDTRSSTHLSSFFSFAGLNYGDSHIDAERLFGKPEKEIPSLKLPVAHAFFLSDERRGSGAHVGYCLRTGLIQSIGISSEYVIEKITSKGIQDKNLLYYGQHWNKIKTAFGEPDWSYSDDHGYKFSSPVNTIPVGTVSFVCYDWENYCCTGINVSWFDEIPKWWFDE